MILEPLELLANATFGGPQPGAFLPPGELHHVPSRRRQLASRAAG